VPVPVAMPVSVPAVMPSVPMTPPVFTMGDVPRDVNESVKPVMMPVPPGSIRRYRKAGQYKAEGKKKSEDGK